ncbi:unnamed protein product, partial [Urochloa humidicola]
AISTDQRGRRIQASCSLLGGARVGARAGVATPSSPLALSRCRESSRRCTLISVTCMICLCCFIRPSVELCAGGPGRAALHQRTPLPIRLSDLSRSGEKYVRAARYVSKSLETDFHHSNSADVSISGGATHTPLPPRPQFLRRIRCPTGRTSAFDFAKELLSSLKIMKQPRVLNPSFPLLLQTFPPPRSLPLFSVVASHLLLPDVPFSLFGCLHRSPQPPPSPLPPDPARGRGSPHLHPARWHGQAAWIQAKPQPPTS